jgi:hypothetical protein
VRSVAVVAFLFCGLAPAQGGDPSASAQDQLTRPARRPRIIFPFPCRDFLGVVSSLFASPSAYQIVYRIFFVAPLLRGRTLGLTSDHGTVTEKEGIQPGVRAGTKRD